MGETEVGACISVSAGIGICAGLLLLLAGIPLFIIGIILLGVPSSNKELAANDAAGRLSTTTPGTRPAGAILTTIGALLSLAGITLLMLSFVSIVCTSGELNYLLDRDVESSRLLPAPVLYSQPMIVTHHKIAPHVTVPRRLTQPRR